MAINTQNTKGFKTLWIGFDEDSEKHQLFFKEHSVRNQEPEYPRNQTLFVLNIPPYATIDCLSCAFTKLCGDVHMITFSKAKGFKTAYIVFKKKSSLDKAMKLSENSIITLNSDENTCLSGIRKWCKEYNDTLCDEQVMKKEIEEYLTWYDKQIEDRAKKQIADDEGWTTIAGGKKRGQFAPSRKESTIGKVHQKEERLKKKKQLLNFYTFQIRESKKQDLAELRKKFELDKKKLQELKSKRTFKPF